ncbi:MAG: RagB/SusD family nutrient uptake outer membrane protein [Sphingobacteriaceae bacterium]|nr:RagB/SusD family nutrient uptake outer membrane protein [Sphingobacteriaceae bacterium]
MKKLYFIGTLLIGSLLLTACLKDLNTAPKYGLNAATVYSNPDNYIKVLSKLYAGLAITGNNGPAGDPDISGIDEGFSAYVRVLWNLQELPTDEAVCGWDDPGIPELNFMTWNSVSPFVVAMYNRIFYQIPLCNEFLRYCTEDWMTQKGFSEAAKTTIRQYALEARFIRALSYYHAMDLFGNVPFVTEADVPGAALPKQINRKALFEFIESELLAIEPNMQAPRFQYARADKATVWSLLAKLYLNAEVYAEVNRYAACVDFSNRVISAGYALDQEYRWLFLADNHLSTEIIFPVTFDGMQTRTYGGTTFLVHAAISDSMAPFQSRFGTNGGWNGLRTTRALYEKFQDTSDTRNFFWTNGHTLDIGRVAGEPFQGYGITKWRNVRRDGSIGNDPTRNFVDIDFPMFRLADIYLTYAEAVTRGGGGDPGLALQYVNALRNRGGIAPLASLTLQQILDERARELYWEGHRRTDLIRYGQFTGGNYTWPWKGGDSAGVAVGEYLNLYPLPATDLVANPNLRQNFNY